MKRVLLLVLSLLLIHQILPPTAAANDNIKFKGDFRYRIEAIDLEDQDARYRHRIRLRFGLNADINEQLSLVFQMSSGSDDPVSNNQSLDEAFSTKNLSLNLAYVTWKPSAVQGLALMAGKMVNPFMSVGKSELLWDPDLTLEGMAANLGHSLEEISLFFNGGLFWVEERSSGDDSYFIGAQGGFKFDLTDTPGYIILGGGYVDYVNAEGFGPFYDADDPAGNTVDLAGDYAEDFNTVDIFAEAGTKLRDIPVAFFADFGTNVAADEDNIGWLIGVSAGKIKDPGSWNLRYQYKYMESDVVVGRFTDSDFIGGGTDGKGHEFNVGYQVMQSTTLALTLFLNKQGLDEEVNYTRFQGDIKFKF
ncbi:MAG TPA: hypothetical protein ENO22_15340 [candidate division Zixibacteria bacterium]|nr:hypothetical protein [candidate division Zixibacteria bacterium]